MYWLMILLQKMLKNLLLTVCATDPRKGHRITFSLGTAFLKRMKSQWTWENYLQMNKWLFGGV